MKVLFSLLLLSSISLVSCETPAPPEEKKTIVMPGSISNKKLNPEEAKIKKELDKKTLQEECDNISTYLTHQLSLFPIYSKTDKYKVIGVQLKFDFFNASTITALRDTKMKVKFIGKGGRIVKEGVYTIPEVIKPNGATFCTVEAEITHQQYNAFTSTEVSFVEAECVSES